MNQSARSDDWDFRRAMGGDIQPLTKGLDRADIRDVSQRSPSEAQLAKRESAQASLGDDNFLSDEFVELLPSHDPIEHRRDGIQTAVLDRLRQGGYPPEARLHIQKMPLIECRRELFKFVTEAQAHDLRCVMVVHGRGKDMASHANVVRSYVAKWLMQFENVQAYASAHAAHGGLGATYVMLRKSERARARNREIQQKRRGG
ncbi:DNA endonuclease SmrA [Halomonas sp. WWR20]